MSAKFYTLLTDIGAAKLASAAALGVPLKITHMAVGSGGGVLPTPNAQQTALVAEERRAALNMLYIDPQNSSQIIAEQVIPENEGGWWIREVGLFDETGALIAVGNCPESYKPKLAEGSGRTQTVRMVLITSSTDNITLKIDPAVVLATRKYVDDKALELKVYVDDLMAKHLAAVDPHSQYAPKDSPTLTGTPKAPTAAAGNNSVQIANTAFVQAAILALIGGAPATLDTLKEIAAAINNDPNFSTTINNALALKAPLASPAMTGTPTAPTAAQTVNNTQIATTAFVKSAVAGLVGSSPEALDTLNELAAALGNDPNFATTVMNALAGKQPLDATLTNLSGKSISGLLEYLGIERVEQLNNETKIYGGKDRSVYFSIRNDGLWGLYDPLRGFIPLGIEQGGTGATDAAGARGKLGLGRFEQRAGETVIYCDDKKTAYFTAREDNQWGLFDGVKFVPLGVQQGGTGANDEVGARNNLGLGSAATGHVRTGKVSRSGDKLFDTPFPNECTAIAFGVMIGQAWMFSPYVTYLNKTGFGFDGRCWSGSGGIQPFGEDVYYIAWGK
ncbi:phage tail protein [Enterobacter roggenkampii]|uniref:phage tail protein n=1 Tax=Enterobacter roggenkampii TaxID=1812935 RepID=UPI00214D1370|nr:phage tail protein [Enterobacter roggenkampii]